MNDPAATPVPSLPPQFESDEAVLIWLEEKLLDVEEARAACNVLVPSQQGDRVSLKQLRRWERAYFLRLGAALGAIVMAFRLQKIGEIAYSTMVARAQGTARKQTSGGIKV